MQYLRFLLYIAVCKISAEMKIFEIYGEEKKLKLRRLSRAYPRDRERCRFLKVSCEFKKQAR
jgi:hypothetical protein